MATTTDWKYPGTAYYQAYKSKDTEDSPKSSDGREKEGFAGDSVIKSVEEWAEHDKIKTVNDDSANVTLGEEDESNYLLAFNFGFALPDKTLLGIEVEYKIKANKASTFNTMDLMLTLNAQVGGYSATPIGVNKATGAWWPTGLTSWTAGGASDLWGYGFTRDVINQAGFGVMLKVENQVLDNVRGDVAYIRVRVTHAD